MCVRNYFKLKTRNSLLLFCQYRIKLRLYERVDRVHSIARALRTTSRVKQFKRLNNNIARPVQTTIVNFINHSPFLFLLFFSLSSFFTIFFRIIRTSLHAQHNAVVVGGTWGEHEGAISPPIFFWGKRFGTSFSSQKLFGILFLPPHKLTPRAPPVISPVVARKLNMLHPRRRGPEKNYLFGREGESELTNHVMVIRTVNYFHSN